jgi:hypothetical protein
VWLPYAGLRLVAEYQLGWFRIGATLLASVDLTRTTTTYVVRNCPLFSDAPCDAETRTFRAGGARVLAALHLGLGL